MGIVNISFELYSFKNINAIRFDPLNGPIITKIHSANIICESGNISTLQIISINPSCIDKKADYFFHNDPIYIMHSDEIRFEKPKKINITIDYLNSIKDTLCLIEHYQC